MLLQFSLKAISGLCLGVLLWGPCWAQKASGADTAVLEMNQAFRQGDKKRLTQLLPQVKGHVLEPWAAYWELKARLEDSSASEVQAFLTRYAGTYQEDRLRNDWLLLLGQRRDWGAFSAYHRDYRMRDDRDVRCYVLWQEYVNGAPDSVALNADEIKKNWYAQRDADDACTNAARALYQKEQITAQEIWRKARLALEAGRFAAARDAVGMVAPEVLPLFEKLNALPEKFLRDKLLAITKKRKELITLGLVKLASSDPNGAARLLQNKWQLQLSPEERNWVWGLIGKQTAQRLGPDAMDYFGKVTRDADLSDDMLAWKVRAALRVAGQPDWPQVLAAIAAMREDARKDASWTYWQARALLATAPEPTTAAISPKTMRTAALTPQRAQGLALLQSIASPRGFYEQLALEELGLTIAHPAPPPPLTSQEKAAARANPGLQRAVHAIVIGLRSEGVREWNYSTNLAQPGGMSERELLAAAQWACERAIWDRCINTSERTRSAFNVEQRYPTPFKPGVVERSQAIGLDPAYVYGLIRQESRFIMDAQSGVGASGLMQIMPATARETARYLGWTGFSTSQLQDEETNIALGTTYLKRALDAFEGSMPLAAAAYNAGPSRARQWRNGPTLEAAMWIENIPFSETRDYVKKVLSNTVNYAALLTGQPQSLKLRLGQVGPRSSSAALETSVLP